MSTAKKVSDPGNLQAEPPKKTEGPLTRECRRNFCRAASHELSNLLGTIAGELDYGLSNSNAFVRNRAMNVALAAVERAINLSRNLSYFAVNPEPQLTHFDLSQMIFDTVELAEKDLRWKQIKFHVLVERARYVRVDAGALQQVLLNLFSRAHASMPQGGTLTVTLRDDGTSAWISCRDNGVGIPKQRLETLFGAASMNASQLLADTQTLELAIARSLVESQGGTIQVESKAGEGTTFAIQLPLDHAYAAPLRYEEMRKHRRVKTTLPVEVAFGTETPIHSEIVTLSVRGCFVSVPTHSLSPLPEPGSTGNLRIYYYQDQVLDISKCRIVSHSKTPAGMGIEFIDFDSRARKLLEAIVKSHGLDP